MALPIDFISTWDYLAPEGVLDTFSSKTTSKCGQIWTIKNEIRPSDIYCYFLARFGPPNGLQNFLRHDDSDNLIHWDWTFKTEYGLLVFLGMNFRTEIHLGGSYPFEEANKTELIRQIKADFKNFGPKMSAIGNRLESWIEFVNPYQRLKRSIAMLTKELNSLLLAPDKEEIPDLSSADDVEAHRKLWEGVISRYSKGFGLCFGIRSMLPVMAEAFINMLLFILMRPDVKADPRLRDNVFRQPIDIRIKSLHINCLGFSKAVDYGHKACAGYHSLVNERNDLLHGNVVIEKLKFNELFFDGRIPVFKEYRSMWQRSLGVDLESVGLKGLEKEIQVVEELVNYVLSCLQEEARVHVGAMLEKSDLGLNVETGRSGILFPDYLVDIHLVLKNKSQQIL
jgi:hypothetical protein